jgi:hypothetical protein
VKRPSDPDGRFVMSGDGRVVHVGGGDHPPDQDAPAWRNPWLIALAVWAVIAVAAWIAVQADASACAKRVTEQCAQGPCGPDAGWSCGLGGVFGMMVWVAVLFLGVIAAGIVWLVRSLGRRRADGVEPPTS